MFKKPWMLLMTGLLIIVVALGVSLGMQWRYLEDMHKMRREYFTAKANSALGEAIKNVERELVLEFVVDQLDSQMLLGHLQRFCDKGEYESAFESIEQPLSTLKSWSKLASQSRLTQDELFTLEAKNKSIRFFFNDTTLLNTDVSDEVQQRFLNAYFFHQDVLNNIVLASILDLESAIRPDLDRFSYSFLEQSIKNALVRVGILEDFSLRVYDPEYVLLYEQAPPFFVESNPYNTMRDELFRNTTLSQRFPFTVEIFFYNHDNYLEATTYTLPSIMVGGIMLFLFVIAFIFFVRKRYFEQGRKNFVHNMTHELKTPTTSIRLASEMLSDETIFNNETQRNRLLVALQSETKRLFFLVEKVLQFTLVTESKIRFNNIEFDMNSILEEAHTVYMYKCQELKGDMMLSLEARHSWVKADKLHMQNVIFNILDNAIKYRKPNVPPQLILRTSNPSPHVLRMEFEDNGIGISKGDQRNIFRQYYRVNTGDVHNVKGFGLGLAYVYQIVKKMRGNVKVESEKGKGSTLIVELPTIDDKKIEQ